MKTYFFPILLLLSILLGGLTGCYYPSFTPYLKPIGEMFLNLLLTTVVPLIFFNITSALTRIESKAVLKKLFVNMFLVFLFTSTIAAIYGILMIQLFPLHAEFIPPIAAQAPTQPDILNQLSNIFTVSEFGLLFSHKHILALIVFALLVGMATSSLPEKGEPFKLFFQAGEAVFIKVFSFIMVLAPLGFFAYFSVVIAELGPKLWLGYTEVIALYYLSALGYFFVILTIYAFLSGKLTAVKLFWRHIFLPAVTSIATCSGAASIPANCIAAQRMQVPAVIYETVIPLGSMLHKDGSVMGGVFKIAFLFAMFHIPFAGFSTLAMVLCVSILVGTVVGAIPSGGMLGELLLLTVYGFSPSCLMIIVTISLLIDPIATMLNVTTNNACSLMLARLQKK